MKTAMSKTLLDMATSLKKKCPDIKIEMTQFELKDDEQKKRIIEQLKHNQTDTPYNTAANSQSTL